ncbi:Nitrogen regulatory protein [Beijerinckiaceae bacterium RH AL1]|nr:PTS IIA-like nitrogen regulatory protein PtsN [Beijerinckiaceae bacterium]VVB47577.1 Nitrogen regulatory protein [Beijerinckiaceae bacterium RH CH11]VVB47658.1 Nitrogen regulatory protein [Beijerinckiaceae bacterium RH AL8]VVC55960.1 Nitrogen regulatory protein [Beijerinckiaceae bacterium RH AL1]
MTLNDLIARDAIIPSLKVATKKQALHELSEIAAQKCGLPAREILDALIQRERLGSTGMGGGIAIPHGKLAKVERIFGVFARVEKPIDFEALDGEPVDLILLLVAPESAGADHLKALARAARLLRERSITAKLRATRDVGMLYQLLAADEAKPHAA